jgi:phage terminase large subunit
MIATPSLTRFMFVVRSSGCPLDQMENFLRGGYVPQPRQLDFHAAARECDLPGGPVRVGYGGARGTAKSHAALAQAVMDDAWRVAGLKVLFLRNVAKAARESFEDLVGKVLRGFPAEYVPSRSRLFLPNGSFVVLGGFVTENDINKYIGIEYDLMVIEDATLITKSKIDRLFGSLRTSKPHWRPRVYLTFNPGGVGHAWAKREYVDPWRTVAQSETRYIHTAVEDNKFINLEYRQYLNSLTGWLRRAWRDGDWDISAGQFFTTFRHDVHVKKLPFQKIPSGWPVWASLDYGFTHPTVIYLHTHNQGILYTIAEQWRQRWQVKQHADALRELLARWGVAPGRLRNFPAGHDCFGDEDGENPTVAQKYKKAGFKLQPANVDRINGAAEMLARLGDPDEGIDPTWIISDACPRLAECLPVLQHDPHNPEDVLKWDIDETGQGGDDPYDAARYGVMAAPTRRFVTLAQRKTKGWNPR